MLRALGGVERSLTVVVSIAYEGERGGDSEQRITGEGVSDLRRSLEVLGHRQGPLARALRRPLTIERLGRHPLGNLAIASAAAALGDYGEASMWLGEQLDIDAAVLPATTEPVRREIELVNRGGLGQAAGGPARTLRFVGDQIRSPDLAVAAIEKAEWTLLAPGDLYRSVLATAAVPDLIAALRRTSARVVWIANLEPDRDEPANTTATNHLEALRSHGVRVDALLHDPSSALKVDPAALARYGVESIVHPLRSARRGAVHGPKELRAALDALMEPDAAGRPAAHRDSGRSGAIRRR